MQKQLIAKTDEAALCIVQSDDGARLIQTWPDGFVMDTWHPTVSDALTVAQQHWGGRLTRWQAASRGTPSWVPTNAAAQIAPEF